MAEQHTELSRDLGVFTITMIGVGAMIGAGIFVLTGIAAGTAGPALMLAFAANGLVTLLTAMAYAELGSAIPEAGGGYLWVKEGLPGPNAFLAGWMSWFAHAAAGSLYALGFSSYVGYLLQQFNIHAVLGIPIEAALFQKGLAVLIALIFVAINFKGVSETGLAGNIVTVTKVLIIGLFIGSGLWVMIKGGSSHWHKFTPLLPKGFTGVLSAMGLTYVAFEGYEIIVQAAEEVKNPKKNIPRAVFWSLLIVIPIYILVAIVAVGAVDTGTAQTTWQWLGEAGELGLAKAASQFMPLGTSLLILGGLLSTISALNATTFSSTRVSFAMGRDRNLPDFFSRVNDVTRTPYLALLASGGLIIFMALAVPIEDVAAAADVMFLLLFLQVNVAIITIRRKYGDKLDYGFLIPFFPITPILAIVLMTIIAVFMFQISPIAWFFVIGWIGAGFLIYYTYARKREREKKQSPVVMQQSLSTNTNDDRYRILVPVANPQTAKKLIDFAAVAAKAHDAELVLVHVITIPKQSPYEVGQRYVKQARDQIMDKTAKMAADSGVNASSVMRIAREPAKAIIDTVEDNKVDMIVMGWQGKRSDPATVIGPNIDKVLRDAHCDVVVLRGEDFTNVKNMLIPIADPKQARLLLETGKMLEQHTGASINLYHIISPELDHDKKAKQKRLDNLYEGLSELKEESESIQKLPYKINIGVTNRVIHKITALSSSYDTTIIGASKEGWFKKLAAGNRTAHIAKSVKGRLILVKQGRTAIQSGFLDIAEFLRSKEPERNF